MPRRSEGLSGFDRRHMLLAGRTLATQCTADFIDDAPVLGYILLLRSRGQHVFKRLA
jgi:hypothetical protein